MVVLFRFLLCFFIISSTLNATIDKKAAIVIDYTTRKVLFENKSTASRFPASITKVMTIYLLFEAIKRNKISLNTKFKASKLACNQMPSKLGLKVGEKISVSDIIKALFVKSANDAAVVAAEGLAGSVSNFCKLMNKKCKVLGMSNTNFVNPSGVPDKNQKSCARDLAKLGMALYRDFPQYRHLFCLKHFSYKSKKYNTHCKILHWYKGADGAKTGYINASGFNILVTAARYNKQGKERRLFTVVMGEKSAKSRDLYAAQLMNKYFKDYQIMDQQNLKNAKNSLLAQINKNEILDQIIMEDEAIFVENTNEKPKIAKLLDELYESDNEDIQEENAILVPASKCLIKKKRRTNSR